VPQGRLAIISYRIVKLETDPFTLDTPALLAVVAAARRHDIDFIWLDVWAYRQQLPWATYNHDHFCQTLAQVMKTVDLVFWLPRSRAAAPGTYQYRIWTTFEATVVTMRELEVVAIGYRLSSTQWQLAFAGSLLLQPFWAKDDGTGVVSLGKVNLNFVLCFISMFLEMSVTLFRFTSIGFYPEWTTYLTYSLMLLLDVTFYFAVRISMHQQVLLARNGKKVLRVMLHGAVRQFPCTSLLKKKRLQRQIINGLQRQLPWLAAYDRRDSLTVKHVLDVLASQLSNGADKAALQSKPDAAALSVYVHAFTEYSAGDAPEGRSLRSWFADSGSRLYRARANTSMRPSARDGRSSADIEISFAGDQKRARNSVFLRSHGWRHWMDAYPYVDSGLGAIREDAIEEPSEIAGAPPNPLARFSSTSDLDNELSMAQLNRVGWSVNLAWPRCLLITPLAYFAVSPPVRSGDLRIWLLSDMVKLYRPDMKQWGVWGFLLVATVNAISVLFMLFYRESLSGPAHTWQGIHSLVIMIVYGCLYFIKVRTDWRNWRYVLRRMRQGGRKIRMPTPPLWPTGKLEYAAIMLGLYSMVATFKAQQTNAEKAAGIPHWNDFTAVASDCNIWVNSTFLLHEGVLGVINAVHGLILSKGHPRGALELVERRRQAHQKSIIA